MKIKIEKKPLVSMIYTKKIQRFNYGQGADMWIM